MNETRPDDVSLPVISLLKGVLYREDDPDLWHRVLRLEARIRDYVAVLGLDLVMDEAEGFCWLRQWASEEGEDALPRLMTRRQLPYLASLVLALLRKKLVESDSSGSTDRVILGRDDLVDLVRVFLPPSTNDARLADQVMAAVARVEALGFVRQLKNQEGAWEVRRIIKAFVDAQWLNDFDERLKAYRDARETEA